MNQEKKYMYRVISSNIEKLEVVKETPKQVVFRRSTPSGGTFDTREAKQCVYQNWFSTWQEAYEFLIKKAETKVSTAKSNLDYYINQLQKIKELKP